MLSWFQSVYIHGCVMVEVDKIQVQWYLNQGMEIGMEKKMDGFQKQGEINEIGLDYGSKLGREREGSRTTSL